MTTPESLTQVARISDAERDRAIRLLREHSVQGRLSPDTFIRRIELALTAQRRADLDELTADLPDQGRLTRLALRAVASVSRFGVRLRGAWQTPRLQPLVLPGPETPVLRSAGCPGRNSGSPTSRSPAPTPSCAGSATSGCSATSPPPTAPW